jgi:ABC-2 type transport system permease protein
LFLILYLIFAVFLNIGRGVPNWPVALLLGIILWNFFAEITSGGLGSITNRGGLIKKISLPRYIVVVSGSISSLINLSLSLVVVSIFMILNNVELSWTIILLPLLIIEVFIFGMGLAFFLAAANVRFRDTKYVWELITRGLFYASAVLYPMSRIAERSEEAAILLMLNPASQVIQDARYVAITHEMPTMYSISGSLWLAIAPMIISVVTLIFGALYFRKRSKFFAEEI